LKCDAGTTEICILDNNTDKASDSDNKYLTDLINTFKNKFCDANKNSNYRWSIFSIIAQLVQSGSKYMFLSREEIIKCCNHLQILDVDMHLILNKWAQNICDNFYNFVKTVPDCSDKEFCQIFVQFYAKAYAAFWYDTTLSIDIDSFLKNLSSKEEPPLFSSSDTNDLQKLTEQSNKMIEDIETMLVQKHSVKELHEQIKALETKTDELTEQIQDKDSKIKTYDEELKQKDLELQELRNQHNKTITENTKLQTDALQKENRILQLQNETQTLQQTKNDLEDELREVGTKFDSEKNARIADGEAKETEIEEQKQKIEQLSSTKSQNEKELQQKTQEMTQLTTELATTKQKLEQKQKLLEESDNKKVQELQKQTEELKNALQMSKTEKDQLQTECDLTTQVVSYMTEMAATYKPDHYLPTIINNIEEERRYPAGAITERLVVLIRCLKLLANHTAQTPETTTQLVNCIDTTLQLPAFDTKSSSQLTDLTKQLCEKYNQKVIDTLLQVTKLRKKTAEITGNDSFETTEQAINAADEYLQTKNQTNKDQNELKHVRARLQELFCLLQQDIYKHDIQNSILEVNFDQIASQESLELQSKLQSVIDKIKQLKNTQNDSQGRHANAFNTVLQAVSAVSNTLQNINTCLSCTFDTSSAKNTKLQDFLQKTVQHTASLKEKHDKEIQEVSKELEQTKNELEKEKEANTNSDTDVRQLQAHHIQKELDEIKELYNKVKAKDTAWKKTTFEQFIETMLKLQLKEYREDTYTLLKDFRQSVRNQLDKETNAAHDQIIVDKDNIIAEKEKTIDEKEQTISEKEKTIDEKEQTISEKEKTIGENQKAIEQKSTRTQELESELESIKKALEEAKQKFEHRNQAFEDEKKKLRESIKSLREQIGSGDSTATNGNIKPILDELQLRFASILEKIDGLSLPTSELSSDTSELMQSLQAALRDVTAKRPDKALLDKLSSVESQIQSLQRKKPTSEEMSEQVSDVFDSQLKKSKTIKELFNSLAGDKKDYYKLYDALRLLAAEFDIDFNVLKQTLRTLLKLQTDDIDTLRHIKSSSTQAGSKAPAICAVFDLDILDTSRSSASIYVTGSNLQPLVCSGKNDIKYDFQYKVWRLRLN
jgi:chromosome segregation ATPase